MKNQALFSSKDKSKKLKCLLQFLFGALRVKCLIPCGFRTATDDTYSIKSRYLRHFHFPALIKHQMVSNLNNA